MQIPRVTICRAQDVVCLVKKERFDAVISIENPDSPASLAAPRLDALFPRKEWDKRQLIMGAWDIECEVEAAAPDGKFRLNPPDVRLVDAVLAFCDRQCVAGKRLLIHCHAGKSRSTAVTLGILYRAMSDGAIHTQAQKVLIAQKCVAHLKALRPQAVPNRTIIRLFDERLGAGGALAAAVRDDPDLALNRCHLNARSGVYVLPHLVTPRPLAPACPV